MILLDTNIISELMRPAPSSVVRDWLNRQAAEQLFIASSTVAELSYGIQALPKGKRRTVLHQQFTLFIEKAFDQRILAFDLDAAVSYGEIMAKRRQLGQPMSVMDGQIAAIALQNKFTLATRNVRDFDQLHLKLANPFEE